MTLAQGSQRPRPGNQRNTPTNADIGEHLRKLGKVNFWVFWERFACPLRIACDPRGWDAEVYKRELHPHFVLDESTLRGRSHLVPTCERSYRLYYCNGLLGQEEIDVERYPETLYRRISHYKEREEERKNSINMRILVRLPPRMYIPSTA